MVKQENEALKGRIRELERSLSSRSASISRTGSAVVEEEQQEQEGKESGGVGVAGG